MAALAAEMGRFSSEGLSDVSVQNRHLHVYRANAEFLRLSEDVGHSLVVTAHAKFPAR